MSTIQGNGDFISTCADVGGGWRRIVNFDISAGDDCPGEWRKATQSGVSFCRVASDYRYTCSSANFSTNGTSYQRVCGRARGYQKGDTVAFMELLFKEPLIKIMFLDYQLLTIVILVSTFGLLLVVMVKQSTTPGIVIELLMEDTVLYLLLAMTITVNQDR